MKKTKFDLALSKAAGYVIEELEKSGFEAYAVGGCVRDAFLKKQPFDFDVATNARPSEVKAALRSDIVLETGIKYGTVTVVFENEHIEVTTYRCDGGYSDSRHPENVSFSGSLKEDLARRDFTVNAMAYNPRLGLVDVFGGQSDIQNKLIRCVGDPKERFCEDALRIMRALRFASTLGFTLDKNTKNAAFECSHLLNKVSAERLRDELVKLVCGQNAADVLIEYAHVLGAFIPEIIPCIGFDQHSKYHKYNVWDHIAHAVQSSRCTSKARLAVLFHDIAKPECFELSADGTGHFKGHAQVCADTARKIMERLKFDKRTIDDVTLAISCHSDINYTEKSVKRRISKYGIDNFELLLDLQCADNSAKHDFCLDRLENIEKWRKTAKDLVEGDACLSLKELAVNGDDMIALGLKGKQIGTMLNTLLEMVLDGSTDNERNRLIEISKELSKKIL